MRLVFVVNQSDFFVTYRLTLAKRAQQLGYDVTVVTPFGAGVDIIRAAGFEWRELPLDPGRMNPLRDVRTIWFLCKLFRELKPAIVHNVTIKPVLYGTFAAHLVSVPKSHQRRFRIGISLYSAAPRLFVGRHRSLSTSYAAPQYERDPTKSRRPQFFCLAPIGSARMPKIDPRIRRRHEQIFSKDVYEWV